MSVNIVQEAGNNSLEGLWLLANFYWFDCENVGSGRKLNASMHALMLVDMPGLGLIKQPLTANFAVIRVEWVFFVIKLA